MRVTQRMLVDNVLRNMSANSEELGSLQDQLASGKRLRKPSDDPQSLSRALKLRESAANNAQYLRNISTGRGWLEASDSSLSQIESVLQRARDAGLRGLSDSIGDDGKKQLAKELDGLLEELVQGLNATHEGKYLFSGRKTSTAPFDVTRVGGRIAAVSYRAGDPLGGLDREISKDVVLSLNIPGDQMVAGQTPMALAASSLIALRDALDGGAAAPTAVDDITTALDGVSSLQATVGTKMQRLDGTEQVLNEEKASISTMLSRAEDADVAEVMTKLMMEENVYKTSLQAGARLIQTSLLDYLR